MSSATVAGNVLVHVSEIMHRVSCVVLINCNLKYNFDFAYFLIYTGAVEPRLTRTNLVKPGLTGAQYPVTNGA